jgi:hypothetical protein
VRALSKQFEIIGMDYHDDPTGIFTDSVQFTSLISECTNLSVGYFNEHSVNEIQNIDYLLELSEAVLKINWEVLPDVRDYRPFDTAKPARLNKGNFGFTDEDLTSLFVDVDKILNRVLFAQCLNVKFFEPEKEMVYEPYGSNEDERISVFINDDGSIKVGLLSFNKFEEFVNYCVEEFNYNPDRYNNLQNYFDSLNSDEETDEDDNNIDNFLFFFDMDLFNADISFFKLNSGENFITTEQMSEILKTQNVTTVDLIEYLYYKGNEKGNPLGIVYNDDENIFELD